VKEKILLVDDTADLLHRFEDVLSRTHEIVTAMGPDAALQAFANHGPFAVVVSGCEPPGPRGDQWVDRILRDSPETVPILVTAADCNAAAEGCASAVALGRAPRILERECASERLRSELESAFDEHRIRADASRNEGALRFSCDALGDFNTELCARISQQTAAIHVLHRFANDLNATESLQEIAHLAAEAASKVSGDRATCVRLWDRVDREVLCSAAVGAQVSDDAHRVDIATQEGNTGILLVERANDRGQKLSSIEDNLLSSVASSAAASVFNQLRRRERDAAQQATILALARLAEQRDNETGKHLERVSLYCKLTAEGLRGDGHFADQITAAWISDLVRSAPLHDIGKVGIPDAILLKPGKLSPDEWEVMKTHADIGADCLRSVIDENRPQSSLRMSLDIAWCHHEKWDGSGYPRGLRGEEIPLSARILALADVYDALTTVRPYKGAWTHERAITWLSQVSGTHLDPRVVKAFLTRADRADTIRARLADRAEDFRS
jgi:response regulator RpfG family c-di-GMP phosphodiesterase